MLGFLSGAVAVLVFQQGAWALLHMIGVMPPPFPVMPVLPFELPQIADSCLWGGVWGAVLGLLIPRLGGHWLLAGFVLGLLGVAAGLLLVPLIRSVPWRALNNHTVAVSLALNLPFGVGTAAIFRLLIRGRRDFRRPTL